MLCPKCGKDNKKGSLFCAECGTSLDAEEESLDALENLVNEEQDAKKYCPNCGYEVQNDDAFCKYCGEEIKEIEEKSYIICPNCGRVNSIFSPNCTNCGQEIKFNTDETREPEAVDESKKYLKGMIFGIVSIGISVAGFFFIFTGQVASIVFAIISIVKCAKGLKEKNKKAILGFILALVAIVLSILIVYLWVYIIAITDFDNSPVNFSFYKDDSAQELIRLFLK